VRAGGGPVIDLGVHRFDVLRYICGPIATISGQVRTFEPERILRDLAGSEHGRFPSNVDDAAFAQLTFEGGGVGHYMFSWGAHGEQFHIPGGQLIWGSKGSLAGRNLTLDGGEKQDVVELYRQRAPEERAGFYPPGLDEDTYGMGLEQYDFFQAIEQRRQTEVSGEEGLRDLAIAYAVIESSVAGRRVTVDEVERSGVDGYQREIDQHYGLV
jgi:1,5-anhydro-D-fructose reductase (1,5-anhydro-D-mannitol-forming)